MTPNLRRQPSTSRIVGKRPQHSPAIMAEFGMSGKWLELLKQIAPGVKRAAFLQDPTAGGSSSAQFNILGC